jgi:ribonucleoside-diphosphate reductase beta chain
MIDNAIENEIYSRYILSCLFLYDKYEEISTEIKPFFPIEHDDLWKFYKSHKDAFWTAEEVDLSEDIKDWEEMSENEKYFIKNILAFFAASDGIVNENIAINFINEVQYPEAKSFYGFQVMMENIHSETYSLLIDTYIKDEKEKDYLFNGLDTIQSIKKKGECALKLI